MALEIERKFLIKSWPDITSAKRLDIRQGYVLDLFNTVVRVRKSNKDGFLTIKRSTGKAALGVNEYEWRIPQWLTSFLLKVSFLGYINKTRYNIDYEGHTFELDVFNGKNAGLVVAEVELANEHEPVKYPSWIGEEVTGQKKYFNKNLAKGKRNE